MNQSTSFMSYTGENCDTPLDELISKHSGSEWKLLFCTEDSKINTSEYVPIPDDFSDYKELLIEVAYNRSDNSYADSKLLRREVTEYFKYNRWVLSGFNTYNSGSIVITFDDENNRIGVYRSSGDIDVIRISYR